MKEIHPASVKSLFLEMSFQGKVFGSGTGFLTSCRSGIALVTNRHVVTGLHQHTGQALDEHDRLPDSLIIWQNSTHGLGLWQPETHALYDADDNPRWFEHPTLGKKVDVVALPIKLDGSSQPIPYDINAPATLIIQPGEVVSVIGFPFGKSSSGRLAIWATGFIASDPDIDYEDLPTRPVTIMIEHREIICVECEGPYFDGTSQMMGLCPECSHHLYGYTNCDHRFVEGRCTACGWKGSRSRFVQSLIDATKS